MKAQSINRHQLLRGQFEGAEAIRPPWSVSESVFTERCTRCFECAKSCHAHLIVKGNGGFPVVTFNRQGCDFCETCVQACPENVLSLTIENQQNAWEHKAIINKDCFSLRGIVCRSCGEICESRAISFKPGTQGVVQVSLNIDVCNGCGECVHVCPAGAIEISKNIETGITL